MDRYKHGDPEYVCEWCSQPNWEPDPQCSFCHRFQPGSTFDRLHGHRSRLKEARARQLQRPTYRDYLRNRRAERES